jgi:ABC-type dipeptide/oligopeptide/nickel transport system permease component
MVIPVLLGVSFLVWGMVHLTPGDPVDVLAFGTTTTEEQREQLRHTLGLDQPFHVQYWTFVGNAVRGDLGKSIFTKRAVTHELMDQLPRTIELTIGGMIVALGIGFTFGIASALKPDSWLDALFMTVSFFGLSMPHFWLGLLLIFIFAVNLGWLPATGQGGLRRLILPSLALGWSFAAIIARLVRQNLLDTLRQEYVLVARAKGLRERMVVWRHALRNALIPVVTIIGLQVGNLLGGAIVIEVVFARQGIGRLAVESILNRDFPVIQGVVLLSATIYVLLNLAVDISYAWLDPRIRYD